VFVICAAPQRLQAQTTWTVSGTGQDTYGQTLKAEAKFTLSGSTLTILLTNKLLTSSSGTPVTHPEDVLTGLFFDTSGTGGTLSPFSAALGSQSTVYYWPNTPDPNPGDGWAYKDGLTGSPLHGKNSGISAAGLGYFDKGKLFSAPHSSLKGNTLDGVGYGILSANFDPDKVGGDLSGKGPLFKYSILFTLTAKNFDLDSIFLDSAGNLRPNPVFFQYGSSLTEPSFSGGSYTLDNDNGQVTTYTTVPEASSLLLLAFGGLPLLALRRRRA
jgi:hypothetical protein